MDISSGFNVAAYSMMQATTSVMSQVSVAMLDKTMEMQEAMGENITQMMELSVNPAVGGNIDIRV